MVIFTIIKFFDCGLEEKDGRVFAVAESLDIPVIPQMSNLLDGAYSTEATLGIRPEDVYVNPAKNAMRGVLEPVGSENTVHLTIGKSSIIALTLQNFRPSIGEEVRISFNVQKSTCLTVR